MFRNASRLLKSTLSAVLSAVLVLLSPGLECYAVSNAVAHSQVGAPIPVVGPMVQQQPRDLLESVIVPLPALSNFSQTTVSLFPADSEVKTIAEVPGRVAALKTNSEAAAKVKKSAFPAFPRLQRAGEKLSRTTKETDQDDIVNEIFLESHGHDNVDLPDPVFGSFADLKSGLRQKTPQAKAQSVAAQSSVPAAVQKKSFNPWQFLKAPGKATWDEWTQAMVIVSMVLFACMFWPQIHKNIGFLHAGDLKQFTNQIWYGWAGGMGANMAVGQYLISKPDREAGGAAVQAICIVMGSIVVSQIFMAGFMSALAFWPIMAASAFGLALGVFKFFNKAPDGLWNLWSKATSLVLLAAVPQLVWTSLWGALAHILPKLAFLSHSIIPLIVAAIVGLLFMIADAHGLLHGRVKKYWDKIGAWSGTALFMNLPVTFWLSNHFNPEGIKQFALRGFLLGAGGNALGSTRAMQVKDAVWLTGALWGVLVGGWAMMFQAFCAGLVSPYLFGALTVIIPAYLIFAYLMSRR